MKKMDEPFAAPRTEGEEGTEKKQGAVFQKPKEIYITLTELICHIGQTL
jgi:hypothetical protein